MKLKGLGGAMFWALDLDDFGGQFCGQGRYPLINYVKSQLNNGIIPVSTTTTKGTTTQSITTTKIGSSTNSVSSGIIELFIF